MEIDMGKFVDCPFCGERGKKTKEHVWAQWLHKTEGARKLLADTHGERIQRNQSALRKDQNGRYQAVEVSPGPYAKWLPNVTVSVCEDCNCGWMSHLEGEAKDILAKFIFDGGTLQLTEGNLQTLATWASKSWMAYALTLAAHQNPFTRADYRAMASSPRPFHGGRILLMHSEEPIAHVGMGITSWLLSSGDSVPDMETTPDNTGYAYLAVATVVLIMTFVPPTAEAAGVADIFAPQLESSPLVQRAWPDPRPQDFPLGALPPGTLADFLVAAEQTREAVGLPTEGLTDDDLAGVLDQYWNGVDPAQLRRRFGKP
ncbi:hypothetical protein ACFWY6_24255 [Streptomyces sp. NPDC059037]|uniref:hypothetical protein n=1 Tax=Streptomyces sp. NPDC059037 TaxID=3346710 RepID=UPI0036847C7A